MTIIKFWGNKKRQESRGRWKSPSGALQIEKIDNDIAYKIPLKSLNECIVIKENKYHHSSITFIVQNEKNLKLRNKRKIVKRLKESIKD